MPMNKTEDMDTFLYDPANAWKEHPTAVQLPTMPCRTIFLEYCLPEFNTDNQNIRQR